MLAYKAKNGPAPSYLKALVTSRTAPRLLKSTSTARLVPPSLREKDLEKAYDRVPREELWYCMRKSGVAEKYVRVVQDMYERSRTVVRCAVGQREEFNVEVGLHQGSALSPFLFAIVMDQLSEKVRQESPWTMMFADDIVICSESREQMEENLERWRFALERRGMKVSRSKTEYMCVNEREGSGTVRLQGEEVKKVQEFKYLGSTVQSNGECGKEVKKRVQAGWNGWRKVSGVLCDQKISARIKGKVYRTVVRPAMLYGLETVSLRKRQESELEVAELKMLRFSLGVTRLDRIRNEYIRGTAHVGRLGDKVREARLRWFGHVQRRESAAPDAPNPSPPPKVRSSDGSWGGARNVERPVGGARSRARHLGGGGEKQKQGEWGEARTKARQVGGTRIKARHVGGVRSRSETSGGSKGPDGKAKGSNATSTAERRRRATSTAEQQSRVMSTAEPQGQATSTAEQQRRATSTAEHSRRATSTDERRLQGDDVRLAGVWNSPRGGRVGARSYRNSPPLATGGAAPPRKLHHGATPPTGTWAERESELTKQKKKFKVRGPGWNSPLLVNIGATPPMEATSWGDAPHRNLGRAGAGNKNLKLRPLAGTLSRDKNGGTPLTEATSCLYACLTTSVHALNETMDGILEYLLTDLDHGITELLDNLSTNFIPDRSRPGLTTTAIGTIDLQGAGGNWATVGGRSRGGRRVHRQREKRKGKSVGLRIGTLNVGTMTGKGRELADMMERRNVDILCVQETRWKGSKARSIGAGFKLFYYGVDSKRNGVGVVLKKEFVRNVLAVKRVSDRVMSLKLEIEGVMLNVVSGYAPQVGCELEEKEKFWSELDEVMESIPMGERVVIGADFNGHVGEGNAGDEEVMGKFGVKERNLEGQMVVDFAKRMDMAVVNTYFQKREEHRVTYKSGGRRTQVDYILCRRGNLKEISDCKVVVGESVARQHRMVVCSMTLLVCKTKR
ncbi:hypothetical protein QTP86_001113 [Hemibagrus guttatus]|nr:hypothetical protein QTP86_001113 [Hemibagrus guttatus]